MRAPGQGADPVRPVSARLRLRWLPPLAALLAIGLTLSLGNWQLRRAEYKQQLARQQASAQSSPAIEIPAGSIDAAGLEGRKVQVAGAWLDDNSIFLDNRTHDGRAGFHVLTPLRLAGQADATAALHVLVLRGWIARDPRERTRLPALKPASGPVRIEGIAQAALPSTLQLGSATEEGRIWQAVRIERYAQWSGLRMQPVIVRQTSPADDGLLRDWPAPAGDVDKHRGYALQWYAMALAVSVWWAWTVWRRRQAGSGSRSR